MEGDTPVREASDERGIHSGWPGGTADPPGPGRPRPEAPCVLALGLCGPGVLALGVLGPGVLGLGVSDPAVFGLAGSCPGPLVSAASGPGHSGS